MRCLVLDYGGTFVKYSVMDENRERSEKGEVPAPIGSVEEFRRVTGELIGRFEDRVEGVAVSFPGFVDAETTYLSGGGAYMCLYHTYLKEIFGACTRLPFTIENDGKCGALAEVWGGALAGAKCGIVIIFGTGIAGGLIQDGRLYKGFHSTAGEFSYLTLDWGMGMDGIAQVRCSASALIAKVAVAKGQELSGFGKIYEKMGVTAGWKKGGVDPAWEGREIDGLAVFEMLEAGDPEVVGIYQAFCRDVAAMILNLQCVYDPEKVAIGGGISRQDRLVPDLEAAIKESSTGLAAMLPAPQLVRCQYQGDANQYGAMYHYLTEFRPDLQ